MSRVLYRLLFSLALVGASIGGVWAEQPIQQLYSHLNSLYRAHKVQDWVFRYTLRPSAQSLKFEYVVLSPALTSTESRQIHQLLSGLLRRAGAGKDNAWIGKTVALKIETGGSDQGGSPTDGQTDLSVSAVRALSSSNPLEVGDRYYYFVDDASTTTDIRRFSSNIIQILSKRGIIATPVIWPSTGVVVGPKRGPHPGELISETVDVLSQKQLRKLITTWTIDLWMDPEGEGYSANIEVPTPGEPSQVRNAVHTIRADAKTFKWGSVQIQPFYRLMFRSNQRILLSFYEVPLPILEPIIAIHTRGDRISYDLRVPLSSKHIRRIRNEIRTALRGLGVHLLRH